MKTKRFNRKLQVNKQTISNLSVEEKAHLRGGDRESVPGGCTGITCDLCDSNISCEERKCDWCETEYPAC